MSVLEDVLAHRVTLDRVERDEGLHRLEHPLLMRRETLRRATSVVEDHGVVEGPDGEAFLDDRCPGGSVRGERAHDLVPDVREGALGLDRHVPLYRVPEVDELLVAQARARSDAGDVAEARGPLAGGGAPA